MQARWRLDHRFVEIDVLLRKVSLVQQDIDGDKSVVELPPCLHRASGLWAAFINPGMGASFADDLGLDMQPPVAAQTAFLEGLRGITAKEFEHALEVLGNRLGADAGTTSPAVPAPVKASAAPGGLLLKDATIEDIVRHLHGRNIEPTFRFLK